MRPRRHPNSNERDIPIWERPELPGKPLVIKRDEHILSRRLIDPDAIKIMYRLINFGHQAFLVGGGVRDVLLGITPKDFDISTDAPPERIRQLFRNSRIIGRRFKINHIYFYGNKIIEVTTFRAPEEVDKEDELPTHRDNNYGDAESDAFRRDLTINALFYDLKTFSIIDYVGGLADLENKIVRLIGDPVQRIISDPVRMIRAVRHAARTDSKIEEKTYQAIVDNASLINNSSKARLYEELVRDFKRGKSKRSFAMLHELGLLKHILPVLDEAILGGAWPLLESVLSRLDDEANAGVEISTSVVFLALSIGILSQTSALEQLSAESLVAIRQYLDVSPEKGIAEQVWIDDDDAPVKKMENLISQVYKPIGVSRKDREEMLDLLLTRYDMFRAYIEQEDPINISRRMHFKQALDLLSLTAHDKLSLECKEYWFEFINSSPRRRRSDSERESRNTRTRRSRPRRRRAQRSTNDNTEDSDG